MVRSVLKVWLVLALAGAALTTQAAPGDRLVFLTATGPTATIGEARNFALSPDDAHLYVAATGTDRVSVFGLDAVSGEATFLASVTSADVPPSIGTPIGIAVSPDGSHVYVGAATGGGAIGMLVFSRDAGTGLLTFVEVQENGVGGAAGLGQTVAISGDGAHVYTADIGTTLGVYARDAITGKLTFIESHEDGVAGVDGLDDVESIVVSPDGNHVYAGGRFDDAIAVFSRNPATGALTFVEVQVDGVGGVDGLVRVRHVTVSPDNLHVYASSAVGVAVFSRNTITGALTFVEAHKDDTVPHIEVAEAAVVTPSGGHLYAVATVGAVNVFTRNSTTGALTFVHDLLDDEVAGGGSGGPVLDGAQDVITTSGGGHVYVVAQNDSGLSVFRPLTVACSVAPAGGCRQPTVSNKSKVVLRDKSPDTKDLLAFKWVLGEATDLADFGDPVTGLDDYALCLYDSSAAPQPLLEAVAPAMGVCPSKPCWKLTSKGPKYRDRERTPDGMLAVKLIAGVEGKAKAIAKAKGETLPMPALPLTTPVTVQVQTAHGECWTATFSTVLENTAEGFRAKAD